MMSVAEILLTVRNQPKQNDCVFGATDGRNTPQNEFPFPPGLDLDELDRVRNGAVSEALFFSEDRIYLVEKAVNSAGKPLGYTVRIGNASKLKELYGAKQTDATKPKAEKQPDPTLSLAFVLSGIGVVLSMITLFFSYSASNAASANKTKIEEIKISLAKEVSPQLKLLDNVVSTKQFSEFRDFLSKQREQDYERFGDLSKAQSDAVINWLRANSIQTQNTRAPVAPADPQASPGDFMNRR